MQPGLHICLSLFTPEQRPALQTCSSTARRSEHTSSNLDPPPRERLVQAHQCLTNKQHAHGYPALVRAQHR